MEARYPPPQKGVSQRYLQSDNVMPTEMPSLPNPSLADFRHVQPTLRHMLGNETHTLLEDLLLLCHSATFERKQQGCFVKERFWRMYPRSGFWYRRTSKCTLVPVFGTGEHPNIPSFRFLVPGNIRQTHPFGNYPFANPRNILDLSTHRFSWFRFALFLTLP